MKGNSNIEEIKGRCDIVDVIERVVPLKRAGANFKGVCPFHSEKTPSFTVSPEKQIFTCFGCGATGDVIEFTKRYYNLDFGDAMERLANQYGITLTNQKGNYVNKEELYKVNREAAIFFYKSFYKNGNSGYKYMIDRGISLDTLKKFAIGYADESWDSLYKYLISKGIDEKKMLSLGLISEKNGKYYDKFRDRVMFPIFNTSDKIIGFGGRIIGEGMPKYLNSQETPVFSKKYNLYGLNVAKREIEKENRSILVEGYMDVISLYDKGIKNVSASLGTALTENQVQLLKRYSLNMLLAYDADDAGQKATLRGINIINSLGAKGKVINIPEGKDPDEYISKNGLTKFMELAEQAEMYGDYRINKLAKDYDLEKMEEKIDFLREVVAVIKVLSPIEMEMYIKSVARDYNISEGAIRGEINKNIELPTNAELPRYKAREIRTERISKIEKEIIRILILNSSYYEKIKSEDIFESEEGIEIFRTIESLYVKGEKIDKKELINLLGKEGQIIVEEMDENLFEGEEDKILDECLGKIYKNRKKKRANELKTMLSMIEEDEEEKIKEITEELIRIEKEVSH